jgi:retron-type reverse transcriptase
MTVYRRANYRAFRLEKRSGGYRRIMAPRAFLKTTQRFLAQRLFSVLPVHDAVHSFRTGRSFITNALVHEGSLRLLKIDIQDFFDFISERMVVDLLARNGFSISESRQLAALTTIGGSIPQGAPTSPVLSNSLLYDFDSAVSSEASARGLRYSRYSDDISLSGASESALEQMAIKIGAELKGRFGMRVNSRKAHLLLPHQRKIVTGVVVNERVTPSKAWRRQVRAAFDRAEREPAAGFARLDELQGYVSYLKAFPMHRTSAAVLRYERICRLLRRMRDVALV